MVEENPSLGKMGKPEGEDGGGTEDLQAEQTERNRRRSISDERRLDMRSRSSTGSWDHSAMNKNQEPRWKWKFKEIFKFYYHEKVERIGNRKIYGCRLPEAGDLGIIKSLFLFF